MDKIPAYVTIHRRLQKQRGRAGDQLCERCGDQAKQWALVGEPKWYSPMAYTDELDAYEPLCYPCHIALDRGIPPCPHGPSAPRRTQGGCRLCYNERQVISFQKRYAEDPEFRDRVQRQARESYARRRRLDNGTEMP